MLLNRSWFIEAHSYYTMARIPRHLHLSGEAGRLRVKKRADTFPDQPRTVKMWSNTCLTSMQTGSSNPVDIIFSQCPRCQLPYISNVVSVPILFLCRMNLARASDTMPPMQCALLCIPYPCAQSDPAALATNYSTGCLPPPLSVGLPELLFDPYPLTVNFR